MLRLMMTRASKFPLLPLLGNGGEQVEESSGQQEAWRDVFTGQFFKKHGGLSWLQDSQ